MAFSLEYQKFFLITRFFSHNSSQNFWKKKYYILPTTSPYTNPSTCVANSNFFYVKKWCVSGNQLNAFGLCAIVIVESENYNTIVFETPNKTEVIIDAHYLFSRRVAWVGILCFLIFSQSSNIFSHKRNCQKK